MPIKHLTSEARMPRIGKLRKGAAMPASGKKPGADQAHFRFTSDEAHVEQAFAEFYPTDPTQLIVYMPYATPDRCFPHFMEVHNAGGLVRRCDGEHILLERRGERIENLTSRCVLCCLDVGSSCECEPRGRLFLILPQLPFFGVVEMPTGSFHDNLNIHGALVSAYEFAQMSGRSLLGIPFRLYRKPVKVSTPMGDGRVMRTKHLVFIEPTSEWTILQLDLLDQRATDPAFWNGSRPELLELPAHFEQPGEETDAESVSAEVWQVDPASDSLNYYHQEATPLRGIKQQQSSEAEEEPQSGLEEPHVEALSEAIESALHAATGSYGFHNGTRALMESLFDLLCIGSAHAPWPSASGAVWITRALLFIETRIKTPGERVKFAAWLVRGKWSVDFDAIDAVVVIEELITSWRKT